MGMRILNEALRKMVNAEKRGFTKVQLQPMSLLMVNYLNVMKSRGNFQISHQSIIYLFCFPYPLHKLAFDALNLSSFDKCFEWYQSVWTWINRGIKVSFPYTDNGHGMVVRSYIIYMGFELTTYLVNLDMHSHSIYTVSIISVFLSWFADNGLFTS